MPWLAFQIDCYHLNFLQHPCRKMPWSHCMSASCRGRPIQFLQKAFTRIQELNYICKGVASHQDLALHCNSSTYALVAQVLLCLVTSGTFSAHFRCYYYKIMEIRGFSFTVLFCCTKALSFHFVWSCSKNSLWFGAVEFAVKSVQFGNIAWLTFSVHFEDALLRQVYSNLQASHNNSAWPMVLD